MEPLKGKIHTDESCVCPPNSFEHLSILDVQSATVWLKHKLKEGYYKKNLDDAMIELLVDEAFEDVAR